MATKWRQNTYGMVLTVDTGIDLTSNTGLTLNVKKHSNGAIASWTGAATGTPTDGLINYTIAAGNLDVTGVYEVVAQATFSGKVYKSSVATTFEVAGDFDSDVVS